MPTCDYTRDGPNGCIAHGNEPQFGGFPGLKRFVLMEDYTKYIGIPFKYGGRTHEQLDCYGLVMLLYKELFRD
jgi:cell wall-associated NlpC family hydrolase